MTLPPCCTIVSIRGPPVRAYTRVPQLRASVRALSFHVRAGCLRIMTEFETKGEMVVFFNFF